MVTAKAGAAARVWTLTAALTGVAAVLTFFLLRLPPVDPQLHLPWLLLVAAFAVAELFPLHTFFGRSAYSRSFTELPTVVGFFALSPLGLVLANVLGVGATLALHRRQPPIKLAYNAVMMWVQTAAAVLLLHALLPGGPTTLDGRTYLAVAVAVLFGYWLSSGVGVPLVTSVLEGQLQRRMFQWSAMFSMVVGAAATCFALVVVTLAVHEPVSLPLSLVLAAISVLAFRSYGIWRQRHQSLKQLHNLTARMPALSETVAVSDLLADAKQLLRADVATCVLFAGREVGEPSMVQTQSGEGPVHLPEVYLGLLREVAADGRGVLHRRARGPESQQVWLRDLVAVPLRSADRVIGALMVGNRLGDVSTFEADDLTLLETLANHARVTLENSRLLDRLRSEVTERAHEARHDALTSLPNRAHFSERLAEAIAGRGLGRQLAVMLIDVDHFKEVNDTLGHSTGDAVLVEIGRRLKSVLGPDEFIARLGGDEFGILAPVTDDTGHVLELAERLHASLHEPCDVGGLHLAVGGSVGIALCPTHGEDPQLLLKRADVAMYAAKAEHAGVEVYDAARDGHSLRRLAMVGRLKAAIAEGALDVYYQPKVALASGEVVGVEALARWDDAQHGAVRPDEFVPLAEHAGLVGPLTVAILRSVAAQWRRWAADGLDLEVAVNVSARSLLDLDFPAHVAQILADHDMPITRLRLELTESSVMGDPRRTSAVLQALHDLGCGLSVDDYGTGYSSLSYLKQLPVDELKIDRSFVRDCATDDSDAAIVRSTIDLGRNLGLRVVAEGVEDRPTWDRLAGMGCDVAQGYLLSRPLPAEQLTGWIAGQGHGWPFLRSVGAGEVAAGEVAAGEVAAGGPQPADAQPPRELTSGP